MQYVEGQLAPVTLLCQPATHCIIATTGLVISRFQNTAGASIYSTENLVVPRRVDIKAGKRCSEQKKGVRKDRSSIMLVKWCIEVCYKHLMCS